MKKQKIPIDRIELWKSSRSVAKMIRIASGAVLKKMPTAKRKAMRKIWNGIIEMIESTPYLNGLDSILNIITIQMAQVQLQVIASQPDKPSRFAKGGIIVKPNFQEKGPELVTPLNIPGNDKIELRIDGKVIGEKALDNKGKKW
jgi:hypothetical protein